MPLISESERHEIYLARLTTRLVNSHIYPSLEAAYKAARAILLDAESIGSIKLMQRIQDKVSAAAEIELAKGWQDYTIGLEDMAEYEAGYSAKMTGAEVGAVLVSPARKQVESFIAKSVMSLTTPQGPSAGVWASHVQNSIDSATKRYSSIIANGYQNKLTVNQMAQALRDSSNTLLKDHATTLARTGQNHYSNNAREAMAWANSSVIKYRQVVITFDNRTTSTCLHWGSAPYNIYKIDDDSYPRFPAHYNCRTYYVYLSELSQAREGKRAAIGGKESDDINPARKLVYRGKKDADLFKAGPIDASISPDAFMRSQPDWFQDSSLGKTRAKLFRDGGLKIDKFADITGRPLTLDQLRELDAAAFKRAGL